ncbi:hypothetical protein [Pseudoalteromonas luteoviolacea]|uniref:Uncharacterized protein n=1 Tax=Pseudoalteromonas luteoviolacea S4054 TaxID=1129367 RepID=A0A0F6A7H6_9GAMM|nr:hypothetical protein [Pseudoalteromonas luteoviolacea]AOT07599.1 hypothetical protein S4054249_06980 [Pseudoalteromonas luteoviolacea]AOT12515.1 hypothetical protein S40542_06980 [Pseudoalteromonas luteoviolacea]AOT17429.1 hypothetical protein S4054_06980 [Pseudoalteromonas luteoviolacea]KKE81339.1 hypothetical protein N479_22655 [Pseudoalteromonas luteoviolacea S4054]KZN70652.1 hypothetical protein N481_20775 [Pseudoalteromonas luteoviolacea S4047-1]
MHFLNPMLQNHPMESAFMQTWLNRLADKYSPCLFTQCGNGNNEQSSENYIDIYDGRHEKAIYVDVSHTPDRQEALAIYDGKLLDSGKFTDVYENAKKYTAMVRCHRLQPGEVIAPSCVSVHSYLVESALCRHYADIGLFGLCGSAKRVYHDYNLVYILNTLDYLNSSLEKDDCLFCFGLDPYLVNWDKPLDELSVESLDALSLGRPICIVSSNFSVAYVNTQLLDKIQNSAIGRTPSFNGFIDSVKALGFVNAEGMSLLPWAFSNKELLWQLSALPKTFEYIVEQAQKQGISHFEVALQSHFVELLLEKLSMCFPITQSFSTYYTYQSHIDDHARIDQCEVMKLSQLGRLDKKTSVGIAVGRLATCGYKWVNDYHYDELFVPCNSILSHGCNLCLHSDFPREPLCPLRLADIAIGRDIEAMPNNYSCDERTLDTGQCISPIEALKAITYGAAIHAKIAGYNQINGVAHYMKLDGDLLSVNKPWRDMKVTLL